MKNTKNFHHYKNCPLYSNSIVLSIDLYNYVFLPVHMYDKKGAQWWIHELTNIVEYPKL